MTRRSANLAQFWLTVGFLLIPGLSFAIAAFIRFRTPLFAYTEVEVRSYLLFKIPITLLRGYIIERLGLNRICCDGWRSGMKELAGRCCVMRGNCYVEKLCGSTEMGTAGKPGYRYARIWQSRRECFLG